MQTKNSERNNIIAVAYDFTEEAACALQHAIVLPKLRLVALI